MYIITYSIHAHLRLIIELRRDKAQVPLTEAVSIHDSLSLSPGLSPMPRASAERLRAKAWRQPLQADTALSRPTPELQRHRIFFSAFWAGDVGIPRGNVGIPQQRGPLIRGGRPLMSVREADYLSPIEVHGAADTRRPSGSGPKCRSCWKSPRARCQDFLKTPPKKLPPVDHYTDRIEPTYRVKPHIAAHACTIADLTPLCTSMSTQVCFTQVLPVFVL